jgi:hypothetical protein
MSQDLDDAVIGEIRLPATARNAVRLRSGDAMPADIGMIRNSEEVQNVSDLLRYLV